MKGKLIKLQDKFILVNDEEIKEGDKHYNLALNIIETTTKYDNGLLQQKIISENPDFSLLSEEDCKTIGWYDVEKLAKNQFSVDKYQQDWAFRRMGFVLGFKTAQSLNDKMFSLEDMNTLANKLINWAIFQKNDGMDIQSKITEIINSLQQTSWDVEVNELNQINKIL